MLDGQRYGSGSELRLERVGPEGAVLLKTHDERAGPTLSRLSPEARGNNDSPGGLGISLKGRSS